MRKGESIQNVVIKDISTDGSGVGRYNDQVIFVKGTVPGDVVNVKVLGKRKKVFQGVVESYASQSEERSDPFCQHFGLCGGCKWQHLSYEAQLKYKQGHVEENLRKFSGLELPQVLPILGSKKTEFYRNKLEYTFSNQRWLTTEEIKSEQDLVRSGLGFHIPGRYDKILDIEKCFLQSEPSNEIRLAVKDYALEKGYEFFDLKHQTGFLRNLIIRTTSTGEQMVILQVAQNDQEKIDDILIYIKDRFPSISSLMYVVNSKGNDSFYDLEVIPFAGNEFINEKMEKLTFRIGPKSFYQTNSKQAHELYKVARDFAGFEGNELVYDLYTGTGTIANFVASNVKKVIGIESVPEAIEDAKVNSEINGIQNTEFYAGDMKDMLETEFIRKHGKPDVIITDPPRAGMHPRVTKLLADLKVDRIVYVSCNPATQARDLQVLGDVYDVKKIQPVDMFPHTQHVENVVLLELRS